MRQTIATPNRFRHRGFSFAEVMFAVVILGIGFIMVAAVFPVAIHQTQSTGEENSAANAARAAAVAIAASPSTQPYLLYDPTPASGTPGSVKQLYVFPPTIKNYVLGIAVPNAVAPPAIVVPFVGPRWDQMKANIISNLDPRFSYVPFYRRENNSPVAELIVIAVANRNRAGYDSTDVQNSNTQTAAVAQTQYSANIVTAAQAFPAAKPNTWIYPDVLTFMTPPSVPNNTILEGSTVSMYDNVETATIPPTPYPVIRTYAIGRPLALNTYEINPVDGLALTAGSSGLWGTSGAITDPVMPGGSPRMTGAVTLNLPTTLQPTVAYATISASTFNPAGEMILSTTPNSAVIPPAATPGAFVIVADDFPFDIGNVLTAQYQVPFNSNIVPMYHVGALNGRIFRLGQPLIPNPDQYSGGAFLLDPAYGMRPGGITSPDQFYPSPTNAYYPPLPVGSRLKVYIIGSGKAGNTGNNSGAAQDVGIFATYMQVQ